MKKLILLVFLVLLSILSLPGRVQAASPALIVLLTPGLKLEDLSSNYHLNQLAQRGSGALMTCHSASGLRSLAASYLTIGAGQRCTAVNGLIILQQDEVWNEQPAALVYQRYNGSMPQHNAIMVPNFSIAKNTEDNISSGVKPGSLGQALRQAGVPLFFWGNHDLPGRPSRPGVLMAVDYQGVILHGQINSATNRTNPNCPALFITNYSLLWDTISAEALSENSILFVDLADLSRLDELKANLPPVHYFQVRAELLRELDNFLGRLSEDSRLGQIPLMLITPYPAKDQVEIGNSLTPVLFVNLNSAPGLLNSASTKRPGLITNLDLAPTILRHFGLPAAASLRGRVIFSTTTEDNLTKLQSFLDLQRTNHLQRPFLLKGYVLLEILLILTVIILLILQYELPRLLAHAILLLNAGPLLFMLLPLTQAATILGRMCIITAVSLLLMVLLCPSKNPLFSLVVLYSLTTSAILTDLSLGAPLMLTSLLGYDPLGGSRFYGLGNEYMGVLLGSSVMSYTLLLELSKAWSKNLEYILRLAFLPGSILLLYLVAAPGWGANVGGGLAFFISLAVFGLGLGQYRITPWSVFSIGGSAIAALVLLFLFDSLRPLEVQSHIGLTAQVLRQEGLANLFPIIERKLAMNLKLMEYSIWSRVLLGFLICSAILFCRPLGLIKTIFAKYIYLSKGFTAGIAGTLAALIFNDSGIVAAATSMLFLTPTLLYLIIMGQREDSPVP